MRALALVLTVAACSYKPGLGATDADSDGPVTPDPDGEVTDTGTDALVGPPPTACVQKWLDNNVVFTIPVFVKSGGTSINNGFDERDPFVSSDKLQIYFSRVDGSNLDILTAIRSDPALPFGAATVKTSLTDETRPDSKVSMTGDDLTAYIATERSNGEGGSDIWQASRATAGITPFDAMTQTDLAAVNDGGDQLDPHISPDGLRLYFANGSPQQVVVSSRASTAEPFGAPVAIPGIGSAAGDADPTLTADERVLIFTSRRAGGLGGTDLYYATRAERDQPFSEVHAIPFNGADDDSDAHVTIDGCSVYFASTRDNGTSDYDLYVTDLQ